MEPGAPHGRGEKEPAEQSMTILVVEDELLIRMIIADALREEGYAVIEAFNGDEAVGILNAGVAVDLVLSDVRMPGSVDGLDLLGIVRQRFPDLPIILTSGHLDPDTALGVGATHFLRKPYQVGRFLELVAIELEKSR